MGKILSVYNRLQAGDYENGKRRVSRLTQFIHATLQMANVYSCIICTQNLSSFSRKLFIWQQH